VVDAGGRKPAPHGNCPFDTRDATHAVYGLIRQRFYFVEVLCIRMHHPDACILNIFDLAASAAHNTRKDLTLLGHEEGGECYGYY
jgi:hypothetical protein